MILVAVVGSREMNLTIIYPLFWFEKVFFVLNKPFTLMVTFVWKPHVGPSTFPASCHKATSWWGFTCFWPILVHFGQEISFLYIFCLSKIWSETRGNSFWAIFWSKYIACGDSIWFLAVFLDFLLDRLVFLFLLFDLSLCLKMVSEN